MPRESLEGPLGDPPKPPLSSRITRLVPSEVRKDKKRKKAKNKKNANPQNERSSLSLTVPAKNSSVISSYLRASFCHGLFPTVTLSTSYTSSLISSPAVVLVLRHSDELSIMVERTEHDYRNSGEIEPHRNGDEIAALEKQSTAASGYSAFEQRTQSIVSRIRSREPGQTAKFHHPLTHTKTSPDVIVDFDGPDDPYRPLNWGFKKKAVTTVLYGLTTMVMSARGNVGE
jgi:hypothetical protein